MAGAGLYYGQDINALTSGNTKNTESYTIEIDGYGDFEMDPAFFDLSRDEQDAIVAEIVEYQKTRIDVEPGGDYKTKGDIIAETAAGMGGAKLGMTLAPVLPHPLATLVSKGIGGALGYFGGSELVNRLSEGNPDSKLTPDPQVLSNSMDF